MPRQVVSPTVEEYLEQIYRLEQEWGIARTGHLAEVVGVSRGTVTNTIDALTHQHLVTHEPYKGVKLTDAGLRIAVDVIRRHRLAERLLTDVLKLDWSSVHEYACRLEHVMTDGLTKPLEKALGHPTACPHGNPIPTACGGILEDASQPLGSLPEGGKGVVVKIVNEAQAILEYLLAIHLVPGTPIEVVEKAPLHGPITLLIDGHRCPISRALASIVWVTKGD
jgi:DtxR family Mn-dependent transcriptional regulator